MTTDQDRDAGTEIRLCARCGHPEHHHELVETESVLEPRTVCTDCGSAHPFEPRPLDE